MSSNPLPPTPPTSSTSPPPPKAIIFDLLTALLDSWSLWDASTPSGTAADGRRWRQQYLALTFGSREYGPGTIYEELVARSAAETGIPPSAPAALLENWAQLSAWPEVGDVLVKLRAKGYLLGVITNCSAGKGRVAVERAEEAAAEEAARQGEGGGRGEWRFDAAITAEESGFYKPARQAYHSVLPGLGVRPEEVLFVAGSAGDVQGATEAGFRVVWHNRVGLPPKGDAVPLREAKTLGDALEGFL